MKEKNMKLKYNANAFLNYCIYFIFGASFFSIPAFSFNGKLLIITWLLVIVLVLLIGLVLVIYHRIVFDLVSMSLILFIISSLLSSALSGFRAFKTTAPILSLLFLALYTYLKSTKKNATCFFLFAYFGCLLFLFYFIAKYYNSLIHLDFNRLGRDFGDQNDIALFMAFGVCYSFYRILFVHKRNLWELILLIPLFLFIICGLSCGSKAFLLTLAVSLPIMIFLRFGKKKWWIAAIVIVLVLISSIGILQLPFLSPFKKRLLSFFQTLFFGYGDDHSTIGRWDMFVNGIQMFFRKPLLGWGISGFKTFAGTNQGWSHNNFSESLCNFGLIGTIFYHYCFFSSIRGFIKNNHQSKVISLSIVCFFIAAMFTVALNSEKIFAFLMPIATASLSKENAIYSIEIKNLFSKKLLKDK